MYRRGFVIDPSIAQTYQGYLLPVAVLQCRLVTMRYFRFTLFRQGTSLDHPISEDDAWWVPLLAGSAVEDITYTRSGPWECSLYWLQHIYEAFSLQETSFLPSNCQAFHTRFCLGCISHFAACPRVCVSDNGRNVSSCVCTLSTYAIKHMYKTEILCLTHATLTPTTTCTNITTFIERLSPWLDSLDT
jgi:hypothetical protein